MGPSRILLVMGAAVLAATAGCVPKAASLDGHACGPHGACLPGYACVAGTCVAAPADAGTRDGGTVDAGAPDAGPPDAGLPGDGGAGDGGISDGGPGDGGAVDGGPAPDGGTCTDPNDDDHDGYRVCDGDCNDHDSYVHPGAREICDGKDDNCNGIIDDIPATYQPPKAHLEVDGVAPSGRVTLQAGDSPVTLTGVVDACDYAGCPPGHPAAELWYRNTQDGRMATGASVTVGPASSGADVSLAPGLHEILLDVRDLCHHDATDRVEIQVGQPLVTGTPGGDTDIRAVCVGPGPDDAWVGTASEARSLNPDLTAESSNPTTHVVRACVVDGTDRAFFGRNNKNDWVQVFADRTDLSNPVGMPVEGSQLGNITRRAMAIDGHGRVWAVSDGHLRVRDHGTTSFVTPTPVDRPPDHGNVSCVTYDGNGHLWVCTDKGVDRLDVSDPDLGNASTSWWLWTASHPVVTTALGAGTASALAANASVLWVLTQDVDNVLLRVNLVGLDQCGNCDLGPRIWTVQVSNWSPPPGKGMNDVVIWPDGDVFVGADSGLYRLQSMPTSTPSWQPTIWETLDAGRAYRDLAVQPGPPETLYGATDAGVVRYRGP